MTRAELLPLIKRLLAVYPNNGVQDVKSLVDGWAMIFADDPAEAVYKAARLHMGTKKWFPKASEIKELIPYAVDLYNAAQRPQLAAQAVDTDNIRTGCDICPYGPKNGEMCLGWDKCRL